MNSYEAHAEMQKAVSHAAYMVFMFQRDIAKGPDHPDYVPAVQKLAKWQYRHHIRRMAVARLRRLFY